MSKYVYAVLATRFDYNDEIFTNDGDQIDFIFGSRKAAQDYADEANIDFMLSNDLSDFFYDPEELFNSLEEISHLFVDDSYNTLKSDVHKEDIKRIIEKHMFFRPYTVERFEIVTKSKKNE